MMFENPSPFEPANMNSFARIVACISFLAIPIVQAHPGYVDHNADIKKIEQVVEAFRAAIIEKDQAKFLKLFATRDIPWIGVLGAEVVARMEKDNLPPPPVHLTASHVKFIENIVKSQDKNEEKFSNVEIDTDGAIASVVFNYSFHVGETKTNWGREAWQLVKLVDGWKINSVIYSIITEAPKAHAEITVPPSVLADYLGTYMIKPGMFLVISREAAGLKVVSGETNLPLYAEAPSKFFEKVYGSTMEFVRGSDGKVTHVLMEEDGKSAKAIRQ